MTTLQSQLTALLPRLEEASSAVGEVQVVTALESKLEDLELWLVTSGKFSNNQSILAQIEDHKVKRHGSVFILVHVVFSHGIANYTSLVTCTSNVCSSLYFCLSVCNRSSCYNIFERLAKISFNFIKFHFI